MRNADNLPIKWVLDMDDTLAHFHEQKNALERFATEKNFFNILKPSKMTKFIKLLVKHNELEAKDIFIVSASPNEQADKDKLQWIERHLPEIPKSNIMFTRLGENKAELFINKYNLSKEDFKYCMLIDDYTKNLIEWKNSGGIAKKYINEYNNTTKNYLKYNISTIVL